MTPVAATKLDEYAKLIGDRSHFVVPLELHRIIGYCKKSLETPNSADDPYILFTVMGVAYTRLGKSKEALANYERAYRLKPNDVDSMTNMGVGLVDAGRVDEAALMWAAVADRPEGKSTVVFANLAEALMACGAANDAWAAFDEAVRHADMSSTYDLFLLAHQAAEIGADCEALEFLARHLAIRQGVSLGERAAGDFIMATPHDLLTRALANSPRLVETVGRLAVIGPSLVHLPTIPRSIGTRSDESRRAASRVFEETRAARAAATHVALSRDGE